MRTCCDLLVLAMQAAVPERGLEDVVERGLDPIIRNVVFADEAEDRRVERRDVTLPIRKGALAILGLLVGDLGEGPRRGVVDDIFDKLVEVAADAGAHAGQQRRDQLHETALHLARAEIVDERFPVAPLLG